MIVYLDSSVVLRKLFKEHRPFPEVNWGEWEIAYSSSLLRVEGLRTIDRLRLQGKLTDQQVAKVIPLFENILDAIGEIPVSGSVLKRAAMPFPTLVRTLDALHLASALLWREHEEKAMVFLTHDNQLGMAAEALGFPVEGIESSK